MKTQISNTIIRCNFISLLFSEYIQTETEIQTDYFEFMELLQNEVDSNGDYRTVFRMLVELDSILNLDVDFHDDLGRSKFAKLARKKIAAELLLLEKRITHPELFISYQNKSELYWGDKFAKRCLIELFAALHLVGAVVDKYGKSVDFIPLIRGIEGLFNVKLPYAYKERNSAISRSKKATFFLEFLTSKLREYIQKSKT